MNTTLPAGWMLAPVDPTIDMLAAADNAGGILSPRALRIYVAMLGAAPTPPATPQDDPITVSLDPDPRGVSVGVWQGSRCIYNGAHPLPASAQDDAKDDIDVLNWLQIEISALDCRYLGDPSYDYDAYWMRDRVLKLVEDARKAFPAPAAGDALPTIKGAAITGGYVVVTPAGWGGDKPQKVRDAILRLFPVNPAYTPPPSAAQQGKGDKNA